MAGQNQARNLRDGVLVIKDGTSPTPLSLTVPLDKGELKFEVKQTNHVIRNRGVIAGRTRGQEEPVEITFVVHFAEWKGESATASTPSIPDALYGQGNASSWVSTACGPFATDLEFTIENPCEGEENEVLTFADFVPDTISFEEGEESDMLTIKGTALVLQPASERGA
jgi:hypothetical protein